MSGPGVGFEYPAVPVSWYKRDVLLFANAIGCDAKDELHFLYELDRRFQAFPTFSIVLPFRGTSPEVIDFYTSQNSKRAAIPGVPKFDSRKVVHGEQAITFLKPLPTTSEGREFEMRAKVLGVYDKGKPGSVVETENLIVEKATGEVYSRAVGMSFFVGQGNWDGPKGPKTVNYPPPEGKKPDAEYVYQTNAESAHLLKLLGNSDPANMKEFAARFASPVKAGDTLVTQIWRMGNVDDEGWEEVRFVTSVKGGKVCLSNGRAKMKIAGHKSKL
ncbi:Thioesterase/thiol ester dehydrase-isomerase [Aureobasidium subglaciale]|nr:Thioesterase/thiol ester dehydrase-isomerase [Aureobasidium subglaciale]